MGHYLIVCTAVSWSTVCTVGGATIALLATIVLDLFGEANHTQFRLLKSSN